MSERVWGEETYQKNLLAGISEISVLFGIAETAKMMSKMNHTIIARELKNLSDFLITSSSNYSSAKIAFPENMFDGNYTYIPEQTYQPKLPEVQNSISPVAPEISKGQNNIKDNTKAKAVESTPAKKIEEKNNNISKDSNRQEIIVAMLKGGAKLTIKDFAKNIKNCSDKTIQRELILMVSKGILKKEGERRWSKYFLA
jgi:hypothetical protein